MPTGKKGKGRKPNRKTKPPGPLSDCRLPVDVFSNILCRLTVKTLLRFRSVCKPWKSLIGSPKFVALHLAHHHSSSAAATTTTPSLLLKSVHNPTSDNKLSLFSLQRLSSLSSSRAAVDHSFPFCFSGMDVIGTHNGIVCVCRAPFGDVISIFNPATKKFLPIHSPPSKFEPEIHDMVSMGFGFDPVTDCYKVIRICNVKEELKVKPAVNVYSTDSGKWRKIEIKGDKILFIFTRCDTVVNGVPYWFSFIQDDYGSRYVVVWFDVVNEVFCHIPMMMLAGGRQFSCCPVDWRGEFAMLGHAFPLDEEDSEFVDVWVIENEWWSKKCAVGPISGMRSLLGCSRNGQIVGKNREGNLFLYDPETGGIESFGVDGNMEDDFVVCNYRESLVSFKGEVPIRKLPKKEDYMKKERNRSVSHGMDEIQIRV